MNAITISPQDSTVISLHQVVLYRESEAVVPPERVSFMGIDIWIERDCPVLTEIAPPGITCQTSMVYVNAPPPWQIMAPIVDNDLSCILCEAYQGIFEVLYKYELLVVHSLVIIIENA